MGLSASPKYQPWLLARRLYCVALAFCLAFLSFQSDVHAGEAAADNPSHLAFAARIAGDALRTRLVIDFDRAPAFSLHFLSNPPRVIIDLPETVFGFEEDALAARGLFESIRYGAMGPGRSRLVLTAGGPLSVDLARVEPREDNRGYRFVLDAVADSDRAFSALVGSQDWTETASTSRGDRVVANAGASDARPYTVVIDPGHGGIDGGARGRGGTEEKTVTLEMAKKIAEKLAAYDDIRVVLTREDDRFVSLPERVRIARQHEAHLLISIHADSIRLPDIRGATVYTLSDRASDRLAAELAQQENLADAAAGVIAQEEQVGVNDILVDLTRRETQAFSVGLARAVLDELRGVVTLINNPHRYAGFSVLRAPDVPSLLVELGYLSNRDDEKLLNDAAWRDRTATLLAQAISGFRQKVYVSAKQL
jgi:N-acetylmuramoyl-L-alanine amidase